MAAPDYLGMFLQDIAASEEYNGVDRMLAERFLREPRDHETSDHLQHWLKSIVNSERFYNIDRVKAVYLLRRHFATGEHAEKAPGAKHTTKKPGNTKAVSSKAHIAPATTRTSNDTNARRTPKGRKRVRSANTPGVVPANTRTSKNTNTRRTPKDGKRVRFANALDVAPAKTQSSNNTNTERQEKGSVCKHTRCTKPPHLASDQQTTGHIKGSLHGKTHQSGAPCE